MTVLVTGAAGFIGAHVVHQLLAEGRNVRATVRKVEDAQFLNAFPKNKGASLEIVTMDLLQQKTVDEAVLGCSVVIHCAAALMVGVKNPLLVVLAFKPPVGALVALQAYRALRRKSILEDASSLVHRQW